MCNEFRRIEEYARREAHLTDAARWRCRALGDEIIDDQLEGVLGPIFAHAFNPGLSYRLKRGLAGDMIYFIAGIVVAVNTDAIRSVIAG